MIWAPPESLSIDEIQARMTTLKHELCASICRNIDGFDGREPMWMEREALRAELARRTETQRHEVSA